MWEKLACKVGHSDQLIICYPRLSENAIGLNVANFDKIPSTVSEIQVIKNWCQKEISIWESHFLI